MAHKILAIDDHPETLDIVVTTLQQHGYNVVGSLSPVEGLALAETERPHLVLVDRNMPEMDGIEVCRRLRAHPQLNHIPIIMFTAEYGVQKKLSGFEAGADDYLTKPTEPAELIARIEALLENIADDEPSPVPPDSSDEHNTILPGKVAPPVAATTALPAGQKLIAVLGARGGSGATTVAINLAVSLAQMNTNTILVDLDMVQGHIGFYLNRQVTGSVNALAHLPGDELEQSLQQQLLPYNNNLQLLLAKPNLYGNHSTLSSHQTAVLVEALLQSGRCVVMDLGLGVTEATRPILDRADQVIVCLRPERVGLAAAKLLLNQLHDTLFEHSVLQSLVFNVGANLHIPQEALQSYLGHQLLALILVEAKDLAQAANKGVPLVQLLPQSNAAALFRQTAVYLAKA